jgi:hypothetical protein
MRTEPTRLCDITLAASARLEPDDMVTNWALITFATVVISDHLLACSV